jgi:uncharacterized cupredoxin-like copper-binding protein
MIASPAGLARIVLPLGVAALLAACAAAGSGPWIYAPSGTASPSLTPAPAPSASPTAAPTVVPAPTPTPLGFTPGTKESPRVVAINTDDLLNFVPSVVPIAEGETISFEVSNSGRATHEFKVGPMDAVMADEASAPEIAEIAPGSTETMTYTFQGPGPFAFACHAPGHFEHGMVGYLPVNGRDVPLLGTKDTPRLVWLNMDDHLAFTPAQVVVAKGETITFLLTNSGVITHEFQVGPADKVAADEVDGTIVVEKDELDAGSVHTVTYTFDGAGPYAYACHEPGHYQAGMRGAITLTTP